MTVTLTVQPRRQRTPLLTSRSSASTPTEGLTADDLAKNNLPDVLARWEQRTERARPDSEQSFCVPKADIVAEGYDLSLNRYKEIVHEEVDHHARRDIIGELVHLRTRSAKVLSTSRRCCDDNLARRCAR